MHSVCFNPAENCARVHALQDGRLVHWHHLSLRVAGYAPANSFSGAADEQGAFSLNGDLGSLFLHACLSAVMNAAEMSGCPVRRCSCMCFGIQSAAFLASRLGADALSEFAGE